MTIATRRAALAVPARRTVLIVSLLAFATALSVAAYYRAISPGMITGAVQSGASHARDGFNSVAAMIAGRSPGERQAGSLAMLKRVRKPELHERALPKVRLPAQPVLPESLFASPAILPVDAALLAPPPLYKLLSVPQSQELVGPPTRLITSPPRSPLIVPPVVTASTPGVPLTPVSAAPEPSSWMMLLIGFAAIGGAMRRRRVQSNATSH